MNVDLAIPSAQWGYGRSSSPSSRGELFFFDRATTKFLGVLVVGEADSLAVEALDDEVSRSS